ncbi:MAG: hypothetical protein CVV18_02755 [Gammaproteobacteria bacterium HGW-Gammaproteobacteria-8]|nr:MAG: hypothetical protein CVV18_02755 [Gammaproteobacteria bacterium HGW-Gammaproteobacteria-8]
MSYRPPCLLESRHELDSFACASLEQTEWLHRHARQSMASGTTKVLVVTPTDNQRVVADYAWSVAQIESADALRRLLKDIKRSM